MSKNGESADGRFSGGFMELVNSDVFQRDLDFFSDLEEGDTLPTPEGLLVISGPVYEPGEELLDFVEALLSMATTVGFWKKVRSDLSEIEQAGFAKEFRERVESLKSGRR